MLFGKPSEILKAIPAEAKTIRILLDRFGQTPDLRTRLCANTDIDQQCLQETDAQVTLFSYVTLAENLTQFIGEDWALDTIGPSGTLSHGALAAAAHSAPTAGESLEVVRRFVYLRAPFLYTERSCNQTDTMLIFRTRVALRLPTLRALMEALIYRIVAMLQPSLGEAVGVLRCHFPWPAPPHAERFCALFKPAVHFNRPECALSMPNHLLDIHSAYDDPRLFSAALAELQASAQRLKTQDIIVTRLLDLFNGQKKGRISEDHAAQQLGMSRRTLIRRLAESGTTYRALLDAHLKERAAAMLEAKLSRSDIAEKLGFSDPGSFNRAYRRWFQA